jgi:diguanylate cyclase (GGDEF)-like protein
MPPDPTGDPARFVDFAAPIRDAQGRLRGVVGAHAHWRWATGIVVRELQRLYEAHGVEVLIRKASGEVLYPQALATANARGVAVLPSGALDGEMQMPDGERYLVAQATVETRTHANLGWEIVVREPLDQALQPVQALRRRLIGLGLAVVGLLTWAAYALAARISQPVERLVQYAHAIEAGELAPALPDHAPQELQQLGEAMRSMTESLLAKESELERVNHSLEDQVHDRTAALQAANLALEQLATIDGLTHVHNRRSFDARLLEAHARQRRYPGGAYALLLVDVDHFKRVNDHHGHPAGDAVLQKVAQLLMGAVRVTDFVARFGGEEFAVLLPQVTSTEELAAVGEKVRAAMAGASFPAVGVLTVSVGGSLSQQDDATPLRVVDRADAALYAAKRAGRNQVQIG